MMPLLCVPALLAADPTAWTTTRTITFDAENLYGHIDGGAELFLETGFESLEVRTLTRGKLELTLETYRMRDPEAGLAIYLGRCGKETPLPSIPFRHTASPQQITALKGRHMVVLNHPTGTAAELPELARVLNEALKALPEAKAADLFAVLPREGRMPGTELLARGPLGLQNVFTFGEGDALSQGGQVWAVGADYKDGKGHVSTTLCLRYASEDAARGALTALERQLDSTLKPLGREPDRLRFQDAEKRFGLVRREGAMLRIDLRLAAEPMH